MFRYLEKFFFTFVLFLSLINFSYSADGDNGSALIIIDMQLPFVTRGGVDQEPENVKKVEDIINAQLEAIKQAKVLKIPIVFIEYENYGLTNPDLKKAVDGYADVKVFIKNTDGMFDGQSTKVEIQKYLDSKKVKTLIITGANGGACVLDSIYGSLESNYNVVALTKAIADFNYREFIYPYAKIYHFTPTCKDCKFKELDNMDTVALELTLNELSNKKVSTLGEKDSKREPKPFIPYPERGNESKDKSATATK